MRSVKILFFLLFSVCFHQTYSQTWELDTLVIHKKATLPVPSLQSTELVFPAKLELVPVALDHIENPYIRYTIQQLKKERITNPELSRALEILIQYVENDSVKKMAEYIRHYLEGNALREEARNIVEQEAFLDSITYTYSDSLVILPTNKMYMHSLLYHIQHDPTYRWLIEKGRDSVMLDIFDAQGHSLSLWLNNDKDYFQRFWIRNDNSDTIGSWLRIFPGGNRIGLILDDDVYQLKSPNARTVQPGSLDNELTKEYFTLKSVKKKPLARRYWTYYTSIDASLGQGLQANWSGGGENSLSMLNNLRTVANYNKNKTSWENYLSYRVGFLQSGDEDFRKNEDRFEINSKMGYNAFKHWFYTTQFNLQTILFNSYDYPKEGEKKLVSNFMSPVYYNLSVGIDYKPNKKFSLYISPIAGKWTVVRDTARINPTRFGVEKGKKSKNDAGARVELKNTVKPFDFLSIKNETILFSSYNDSKQNIFIDWKVQFDFHINYFMKATVYTYIMLDKSYSKKFQFKETLNLGVNFRV